MSDCTSKLFRFIPCCAPSNCFISAGLSQLVRFLIVKLIYLDLTWVLYLWLIILSVTGDVLIDNETLLVTNFVNFKIKPVQSFGCAHRNSVHTCIHRGECSYLYDYLLFLRKKVFRSIRWVCAESMEESHVEIAVACTAQRGGQRRQRAEDIAVHVHR
jgi:hypothetical protein